ncbi:BURP domain-containing protein 5 [Jatropha curcas]|uniref:BURP domain-containing protein 5 n=1 Tax=Jatropha curcas TaxID=180498 RepID=UPI0005FB3F7D|nr:BURP domain-containing protein 5 [Jatropha curcas]
MVLMEFRLFIILALLSVVITGNNAALPAEVYWHSKLPNTTIPQEFLNLLQPDMGDKPIYWENLEKAYIKYDRRYENAFVGSRDDTREKFHKHNLNLPNSTGFFVYNDLHVGQKMRLHITKSTNKARILPRQVADSIPFSVDHLPAILQRFSVKPESPQAKFIKQTIKDCESSGIKGEDRYCATSLESLVDFTVKHVGDNAQILFNEIDEQRREQEYTITDVKLIGENHVVCHKQKYPYAVYFCHALNGTKVYIAGLVGGDGIKAKGVVACHSDTSAWNPGHLAFLLLNMKPGDGTVCHFIKSDTIAVVSNNEIIETKPH